MKRVIVCVCAYLVIVASSYKVVSADEALPSNRESAVETYIATLYSQIDFTRSARLSYDVFDKAIHGYLNLRSAGKLSLTKEIISICNFSLPSTVNRLWIIDLAAKKVLFNTYVAHGEGSGEDSAFAFSNDANSHQSSLGFYVTADTYDGEHGTSLHLNGMDQGFNDAAFDRGIVVHGAPYVCNQFICAHQRLGRSWGCPAVPAKLSLPIINAIKDSTCLFVYYPDANYLQSSYWVNNKIADVPGGTIYEAVMKQDAEKRTVGQ